jgi:PAS domain S-box-containing protein
MNILIVDDKEEDRYLLEVLLKGNGHDVTSVANGAEAIDKLKSAGFDLIISDILMPVMDGFELCQKVKTDQTLWRIPFVIYTATYTDPQDEAYALKIGADRFILKPCEPEIFLTAIEEVMAAAGRQDIVSLQPLKEEKETYKLYSERLVKKLEDKIIQLERAGKTLRQSEEKYRILAEKSLQGLLVIQDFRIVFANKTLAEISGYTVEELLSLSPEKVMAVIHPDDQSLVWGRFRDRLAGKTVPSRYEFRGIRKDGSVIWLEMLASLIEYHGKFAIQGAVVDITERKRIEEELRKSEERFKQTAENAVEWIWEVDARGLYTYASPIVENILGYRPEEVVGIKHFYDFFHTEDREMLKKAAFEVFEGQRSFRNFANRNVRKDGETVWLSTSGVPFRDEKGNFLGYRGADTDITELKRSEEELRRSEEAYRNLLETARDVIFTVSPDGTLASLNPAFHAITGWSVADWIGKPFSLILHPDDLPLAMEKFNRGLQGELNEVFELRVSARLGGYVVGEFIIVPQIQNGKVVNILGIARDITERKQAEQEMASLQEQLRQSQKMEAIGRLAGGIAHDFNNLLTVIKGNSQLSLLDLREGDPLKANIEEIRTASERASDLIKQLLAFSRKQIMEMQVIDLNLILMKLDNMLHRILGEDIELATILTEGIGKVKADPGQIEQVVVNLAVNSRDAMPSGGKLTIETANVQLDEEYARRHIAVKPGQYVMLSVSDTGVGMIPEVKERVFEPFFSTKEIGQGTGLGLSTVYGIVKQSGGNIWVYSEPGQGATFKIYLPQVDEPLSELKEVVSEEIPRGDETILIVEDEEIVRKLAVRILKGLGYTILEAPEGGAALILCEDFKKPIHLILTDVVMPGMSGLKLVERLREIHPEIKVLYMSGYTDNAILHHGVLEKGTHFIQKPFTLENLARKVREVLDRF